MQPSDLIPKNLWVNLTVVLPGMVTYGTWRLVVFYIGYTEINFEKIDDSLVLTLSVLFAIALIQQALGITVEALLTALSWLTKKFLPSFYLLFIGRFYALAKEQLTEGALRTLGQFFLSLNLAIGQALVLLFAYAVQNKCARPPQAWLFYLLSIIIAVTTFVACFRCWNAVLAVKAVKDGQTKKIFHLGSYI